MEISAKKFMRMQPYARKVTEVEEYYLRLAIRLAKEWNKMGALPHLSDAQREAVVLAVVGYFQDVVTDAGIWRSFTMMHRHLYGKSIPFYPRTDSYTDDELNLDDLRFIIWYAIEGQHYHNFNISPFHGDIERLARRFFEILDEVYEHAPEARAYNLKIGVDPEDPADANSIFELSSWLFYHCYFLKHAGKIAIAKAQIEAREMLKKEGENAAEKIQDLLDRLMLSQPCGPLALPIGQWVQMMATGHLPQTECPASATRIHPLYTDFMKANGKEIAFFADYDALQQFLIEGMGWEAETDGIFPNLKAHSHFVVLANSAHGILIAPDMAQFVAMPGNVLYDKEAAQREAHTIITQPGRCPADLIRYLFSHELLPDAQLPGDTTGTLLHDNWDFLARLYLQEYYV
ncbi:MAG: DUF3843 family protein [Sodaliphilus sp.]